MKDGHQKKPPQPPDFSGLPEIPASTRDFLRNLLQQQRDSVLWTVRPVGGDSVAARLTDDGSIAVDIHVIHPIGSTDSTGSMDSTDLPDSTADRSPTVSTGKLTRRAKPDGVVEFELCFDRPPAGTFHPYALCLVPLKLWQFDPVSLGGLPDTLVQPAVEASRPLAAEGVGALAAAGDVSGPIVAANERLEVEWSDGQLNVRLAIPPRYRDQPVVVETQTLNVWGKRQTSRQLVSLETPVTEGKFAGYRTTSLDRPEPNRIAFNQLRITVRPLREDDLPWLRPDQVDSFLAGQKLTVLTTLAEGFPLRACAVWADQRAAIADPQAAWLLRVATGKGVR